MRALMIVALAFATSLAAQSYTVSSGSVSYTDLSSPTPSNLTAPLQLTAAISPSGFSFQYFGATFTNFKLGSGGYMIMGSGGTVTGKYATHSTVPGLVISPNWDYLAPGQYLYPATAPTLPPPGQCNYTWSGGVLSVEWWNIPLATNSSVGVRMKAVLDSATGIIELHYGSVPAGCTGSATGISHSAAISGPTSAATQEIIDATDGGYINSLGGITAWPANRYVRFTPTGSTPVNNPPTITVEQASAVVSNGGVVNVNHGISVATMVFSLKAGDADGDAVSLSAAVTNLGSTGIVLSEWQSGSAGVPYTLNPTSGVFNTAAGVTHFVTLTASDGTDATNFSFSIVQAAAPPTPAMAVSDGASVSHGQSAAGSNRDFGSIDIAAGPTGAVTITISNSGAGDLTVNSFNMTGDAAHFVLDTNGVSSPVTSGNNTTFTVQFDPVSAGQKVAQVSFVHNDPAVTSPFSFEVTGIGTTVTPTPIVVVRETSLGGAVIANGAAPAGIRLFGSMDVANSPSAPITIFVQNAGSATLTLGTPFSTDGDFTVNAGGFPGTLGVGASATFTVTFTPGSVGAKAASIQFTHDDSSTATPFSFGVTGTATTTTPAPGPGNNAGNGGGGGCNVASCDYWMFVLIIVAVAGLGARTRRQRAR